ncbi:hypothetical protein FE249_18035 (plasmid) [Acidiphilium multivorum]|uniref:hypothetical protein n=1 Tax=Acidiphilium TaxID=522 RepID=UPI00157AF9B7|nr:MULTISPECIES: hypothetical protein [Acidiphilium]UNC16157.1 hypothetical protein FE249_18035 [Acidiphilium multivorum]
MITDGKFVEAAGAVEPIGQVDLQRPVDLDGAGNHGLVSFRASIGHLIIHDVHAECLHGGAVMKEVSGFTDVSLGPAFLERSYFGDDVRRFVRRYGINTASTAVVVATACQEVVPVVLSFEGGRLPVAPENLHSVFGRRRYLRVPPDWALATPPADGALPGPSMDRGATAPEICQDHVIQLIPFTRRRAEIWRSDLDVDANRQLLQDCLEIFALNPLNRLQGLATNAECDGLDQGCSPGF